MKMLIVVLGLFFLAVSCSPAPDNVQLVFRYQEHKNNQDLEAALDMFSEDASLHFGPLGSLTGKEQIRSIQQYDLALDTKLQFDDCIAIEDQVACRTTETNNWLDLANIGSIVYDESLFTFTPDGHIKSISATLSPDSSQKLGTVMVQFDEWAKSNWPEEYAALFSDEGKFSYSFQNGERVLELLRKRRADQPE